MSCLHLLMLLPVLGPKKTCVAVMRAISCLPWCVVHLPTLFDTPSGSACVKENKQMQDQDRLFEGVLGPVTFNINQQPIWQGETWDRRVGKAAESSVTVTQCCPVSWDPASD